MPKDIQGGHYLKSVEYSDFSGGMYTKRPKEMIPYNASPYCKNVLYDEKNRLSKVFAVTELLTAANNAFADNPIYNLYNYIETDGSEVLIIQAETVSTTTMSLWRLRTDATAVTDITPTGVTLALYRRLNFATHKGLLYATNGTNDLLCGDANSTATWRKYHTAQLEKFRYIATHNYRLWMARSVENPIRVIYTGVNEGHFGAYYGDEGVNPTTNASYVGSENWLDFPTADGTPITGICEFQDSLLVFKPYHIFRIFGDPTYGVTIKTVSEGIGCVAPDSIAVRHDSVVFFMGHDGVYGYGDVKLLISAEDQKAYAGGSVIRLTSEIDDYWDTYVTAPNPLARRALIKSGATDLGNLTTKTNCSVCTPTYSTWRPIVLTVDLNTDTQDLIQQVTVDASLAIRSTTTAGTYDPNIYYAQTFDQGAKLALTAGIVYQVDLYLTNSDTLTSTQKLNVLITATRTEDGYTVPDLSVIYAEGQFDCSSVTEAGWYAVSMSYWDYPQATSAGTSIPKLALVVKAVGDTDALYVSMGYSNTSIYDNGVMINSNKNSPSSQSTKDYAFKVRLENFEQEAIVVTNAFDASSDDSFVCWDELSIEMDNKTANGYLRRIKLVKLEYDLSANGTDWDGYVEANSLRDIQGTKKYIRFKLTFRRATGTAPDDTDSFTIIGFKAFYRNQATATNLVKGIIWDDRYLLACKLADSGG